MWTWCVENRSRAIRRIYTRAFRNSKRIGGSIQTGRRQGRRNAFGCTLLFRVIRYARNRRAAARARRRARACTWVHRVHCPWCASRVTIIGTRKHIYLYTTATHVAMKQRKLRHFSSIFDIIRRKHFLNICVNVCIFFFSSYAIRRFSQLSRHCSE